MTTDPTTKTLTDKEKRFAELYVENYFAQESKTNTEIAIESGYAKDSAYQRGYENTTYRLKPHVVKRIEELKEDFRIRNQITPEKHMARLNDIYKRGLEKNMLHTSLNAEVYRGKMAGYYVERKVIANQQLENQSEEDLEKQLKDMTEKYTIITDHTRKGLNGKKRK